MVHRGAIARDLEDSLKSCGSAGDRLLHVVVATVRNRGERRQIGITTGDDRIDDGGNLVGAEYDGLHEAGPGPERNGAPCPRGDRAVVRDDDEHDVAAQVRAQARHVRGPGEELRGVDGELDLADHTEHRLISSRSFRRSRRRSSRTINTATAAARRSRRRAASAMARSAARPTRRSAASRSRAGARSGTRLRAGRRGDRPRA